jgi:hypothetical protein
MQLRASQGPAAANAAAVELARAHRIDGVVPAAASVSVRAKLYSPSSAAGSAVPDAGWDRANAVEVAVTAPGRSVFGKAVGHTAPTVTRRATAWIANVDAATCVMPILLPYSGLYKLGFGSAPDGTAPDVTQPQLNRISEWTPSYKTIVLIPPNQSWVAWDNAGYNNYGNWMPADFTGGAAQLTNFGDWVAQRDCLAARAEAKKPGVVTMRWDHGSGATARTILQELAEEMPNHCRFRSTSSATCWTSPTATVAGVRTRIVYGDYTTSTSTSGQVVVRAVGELKLMCYFRASSDVCPEQPNYPNGGWYAGAFRTTGYPPGTVIGIVEAPVSVDLERTTVLGDIVTNVQRLVLVR